MKSKFSNHQVSSLLNYLIVYHKFNNLLKGPFAAGEQAAHCNIREKAIATTKALLLFVQNFPAWLALKHYGFFFMRQLTANGPVLWYSQKQACVYYSLLTALSGSLPIKVNISATVETKVLTFTSQSV